MPQGTPRCLWLTALLCLALCTPVLASDHADTPETTADPAADLGDLYAWANGNTLVAAFTFAGDREPGASVGTFDGDVLYTLHIDNNADFQSDIDVFIRFGQNPAGNWGVQVENLPGAGGTVTGAVNTVIQVGNGIFVFAGLRDDPSFADAQGLQDSIANGELLFDNTRDTGAGKNTTAVVLEMDRALTTNGNTQLRLWATTGRR